MTDPQAADRAATPQNAGPQAPAPPSAAPEDPPLADRVAQAVESTPGVAGLHGGRFGEVATYLPGRRIAGIRLGDTAAQVHVVIDYGTKVPDVAAAVRDAVAPLVDTPVDVTVEDVAAPAATSQRPPAARETATDPDPTDHPTTGRTS